tara:strand:+ start:103 stop:744 length:642 start_codon:yes stop_codon:yes gene_type:complete
MKKLLLSVVFSVLYITSASADMGVNVGVSGSGGLFAASATETSGTEKNNGTEHGSAGWASIFAELSVNDKFVFGVDYVPAALETDTTETANSSQVDNATTTQKIQLDFEDLTTVYVGVMLSDSFYAKAGVAMVEVITNENLGSGGNYGNADLDGSMFGVGYVYNADNGAFIRVEGNYLSFDSVSLTNANNSDVSVKLKNLDGIAGKISIGKSF